VRALVQNWSTLVVRGIVGIVFGIVALLWPDLTVGVIVGIFGAFAIVYGIVAVVSALVARSNAQRWAGDLVEGLVAIGAGLVVLLWPDLTATGVLILMGLFALAVGAAQLAAALGIRHLMRRTWPLALSGVISIAFGIALLSASSEGAVTLAWLVGLYAIAFGVSLVVLGLSLRRVGRELNRP
jgi:uncharacterized membrane protein HdeD (DUF308 family)